MKAIEIQKVLKDKYHLDDHQSKDISQYIESIITDSVEPVMTIGEPMVAYQKASSTVSSGASHQDDIAVNTSDNNTTMISAALMPNISDLYTSNTSMLLDLLINKNQIGPKFLAERVFDMTQNTFRVYRNEKTKELPPRLKEIGYGIHELYNKGILLFGTKEKFEKWLQKEQYGLGYSKPIDMVNTMTGIQLILEELIRIEYGATA